MRIRSRNIPSEARAGIGKNEAWITHGFVWLFFVHRCQGMAPSAMMELQIESEVDSDRVCKAMSLNHAPLQPGSSSVKTTCRLIAEPTGAVRSGNSVSHA